MYNAGKCLGLILVALLMMCCLHEAVASDQSKPVTYHVNATESIGKIDVNIYGQFLEHIFNSVHSGLWGDMILNPSFERRPAVATWVIEDDAITTEDIAKNTVGPNIRPNLKSRSCLELRNLRVAELSQRLLAACFASSKQPDSGFVVTTVVAVELIDSRVQREHGEEDCDNPQRLTACPCPLFCNHGNYSW